MRGTRNLFSQLAHLTIPALVAIFVFTPHSAKAQLSSVEIADLNKQAVDNGWTFQVTENEATQYPLNQICGTKVPDGYAPPRERIGSASLNAASLPAKFDWRDTVAMPPIRNQGGCGSCWAFSSIGAMECAIKLFEREDVNLSEQWLVSCNLSGWSCAGGWLAFDYLMNTGDPCGGSGAVMETAFPYSQSNGSCHCPYAHPYKIDNWAFVGPQWATPSVTALKQAILDHGPISVCVTATSAFQGYGGGIFNQDTDQPINHAVVLVGWDDTQGGGIWFMRNSWGSGWGEGGYMRIGYNMCNIGFGAAFIEYGGIGISADTKFGPGPDTIAFSGNTTRQVTSWNWQFGDGATSTDQNPVHSYAPGCYNVTLTVQTPTKTYTSTKTDFIELYADTLAVDNIVANAGKKVRVDISARNCLPVTSMIVPFTWAGQYPPSIDSVSIAGTRSAGAALSQTSDDTNNKRRAYMIDFSNTTAHELTCGNGPVLSLYFKVGMNVPDGAVLPINVQAYGYQYPTINSGEHTYTPGTVAGQISMCLAGDFNNDNAGPDIADLAEMIGYLYLSGTPPGSMSKANVDGSAGIDIGDVTALISYLYLNGPRLSCGS